MASGSNSLTTYYAKRIIGDTNAQSSATALLQTGTGIATDMWILGHTLHDDYGIHYDYDSSSSANDKLELYGGSSTPTAWVQLNNGNTYILGQVGINYDPNTANNPYQVYVNGDIRMDGCLHIFPISDGYIAGIRIHSYNNWSTILLCGPDNTGDTTTSTKSWLIGNDNGTFYITHNGSDSSTTGYLIASTENSKGYWQFYDRVGINGIDNTKNFYVNGTAYFVGNTTHDGIVYFADGTTYYINNSADGYLNTLKLVSNLTFDSTSSTGTSGKISWSGSGDGADIYYYVPVAEQGNLVINTRDDTNCLVAFAYNDTITAYMNNSTPCFYPAVNNVGNIGTKDNEWATTYTRQIYVRHINASKNVTTDQNIYYGYNYATHHYFYTNDGSANNTTRTHRATIDATGLYINQIDTQRNAGIIGKYNANKAALIWSMGSAYNIAADGTGLGNLYGAAYGYGGKDYLDSKAYAGGHQFIWCNNGAPQVALGSDGIWIKKAGGIYWDPYVESASDASDATSIYQIVSGVAGGTELRISQQNEAADVINLCAPSYIYFNSKKAFTISDTWLRINEDKGFSSGIYTGTSLIRTDNQLQVGSAGADFYANSSGNGYFSNTLGIGGTNTSYKLYATGTIYANGGYLKSTLNSNTLTIGSANASWCHFSSGVKYHFNPDIWAVGGFHVTDTAGSDLGANYTQTECTVNNTNGKIGIYSSTNRGLYEYTDGKWIVYLQHSDDTVRFGYNAYVYYATRAANDSDGNAINSTYLKKSGGTMTGALTFANNTWNVVGDDCAMGDQNVAGAFCLKGQNGTTNIRFIQYGGTAAGTISWDGTNFSITGTVSTSISGNAVTATKLQTARNLWGNSFNGTAAIDGTITLGDEKPVIAKITRKKSGAGGWAFTPLQVKDNAGTDFAHFGVFGSANALSYIYIGANGYDSTANLRIDGSGNLTAPKFTGAVVGNVTGNCSGSSGSCTGNAETATSSPRLSSSGYQDTCLSYYQTSGSFDGNSGWCHYIICNHGAGSTYYHYTIGLPFWDVPKYKRQTGSTSSVSGWHTFITSENIGSQSVSSASNADKLDGYHHDSFAKTASHNNLTASTNEFTCAASGQSGNYWINYRTAGGTNGNITDFYIGKGNTASLCRITQDAFHATSGNVAIWSSNNYRLAAQTDGNLVLYNTNGSSRWSSGTGSSIRVKYNIKSLEKSELNNFMKLNAVSFNYRPELNMEDTRTRFGLIAEEVKSLYPNLVFTPDDYDDAKFDITKGLNQPRIILYYEQFIPLLIKMVQNQQRQIEKLEKQIKCD